MNLPKYPNLNRIFSFMVPTIKKQKIRVINLSVNKTFYE